LEINRERTEIEKYKRDLQRQLQDLQFDLDKQRTELKNEFDGILRKREHEWRMQADDFDSAILAKELEVNMVIFIINRALKSDKFLFGKIINF
jgi:predicted  nucleic acid-binding Zn-ribbon protein